MTIDYIKVMDTLIACDVVPDINIIISLPGN
jgi:hypothetical protein